MYGKYGRGGGRGGNHGRMAVPPRSSAAAAVAITPRNRTALGNLRGKSNNNMLKKNANSDVLPSSGTEETFSLVHPPRALPFAMIIRLISDLVEEFRRAQSEGKEVRIKFGHQGTNSNVNIIDVGGKQFKFTWGSEQGDLCDIYEEQQDGEDGSGLLVASGSAWRKLNVQPILNESIQKNFKLRSEEAARFQKSRKAIVLDHGTSVVKPSKPMSFSSNDVTARKAPFKSANDIPAKKDKVEADSVSLARRSVAAVDKAQSSSKMKSKVRESAPVTAPAQKIQTFSIHSKSSDLRNHLITQLTENPKGLSVKAIEKLIGVQAKKIEPMLKTIANYQAPGRYVLKPGIEKESEKKLSPQNESSPEDQHAGSPLEVLSPLSDKVEQNIEQQLHLTPKQDSDINITEELDGHPNDSPGIDANTKASISDGSVSSSSSESGSDSDSDSGSSDSASASGSSSDSESDPSSSGEVSDVNVDIMSDNDKVDIEVESLEKLHESKSTPSVDRDESEHSDHREGGDEKEEGQFSKNSEDVDIDDGEYVSNMAQHYIVEKITSDADEDTEMAADDVFHGEAEVEPRDIKSSLSPVQCKKEDISSPITVRNDHLRVTEEERTVANGNQTDSNLVKSENLPRSTAKQDHDSSQSHTGSEKSRTKTKSRVHLEKREGEDADIGRNKESTPGLDLPGNRTSKLLIDSSEEALQPASLSGKFSYDEYPSRRSSAMMAVDTAKGVNDREQFDKHADGRRSSTRADNTSSKLKNNDSLQKAGKHNVTSGKASRLSDGVSKSVHENDAFGTRNFSAYEKPSRCGVDIKEAVDEGAEGKEKSVNHFKLSKDSENVEKHARCIDSQSNRLAEETGNLKDTGTMRQSSLQVASKDKNFEKEDMLKREYSDLELGELRESYSEEEPQRPKFTSEKTQSGMSTIEYKEKRGARRECEDHEFTRGANGSLPLETKGQSTPDQTGDNNKLDGRSGKRLLNDGSSDVLRPSKRPTVSQTRQNQHLDYPNSEQISRPVRMTDAPNKAASADMLKLSPPLPESQVKNSRSENMVKVQNMTAENDKDSIKKIKGNGCLSEKPKENPGAVKNSSSLKRKILSSGEDFYVKYEKDKPELRGPITSIEQFKEYTGEYQEKYSVYRTLNSILESDKEDFKNFEEELLSAKAKGDMKSYDEIAHRVIQAYSHCGKRHKRMKRVFYMLHEELTTLKQRASDFAAKP
eukprot:TRINITY_DN6375_c0_g1_i1.p1 TRINITY_DN6375_c0_g1~~TRINITY_DN6375_c0_g1_i1.p1  ORF type:complete len:1210 (+),score=342.88 TRINITY_DN6375_c0_g1_i1:189-3818(+)